MNSPQHASKAGERRERGQSLLEVALLFPFVLVLGLLVLDFGIAMDERAQLVQGLREGGRVAAAGQDPTAVETRVLSESSDLIDATNVDVCYLDGDDAGVSVGDIEDAARISIVGYAYEPVIASELLGAFGISTSFPMEPSAEAQLISEAQGVVTPCP